MSNFRKSHWIIGEESRYITIFNRYLQSKMSPRNQFYDILDLLKHNQHIFLSERISAVQSDVLSKIAFFWSYFPAQVRSLITIQSVGGI